MYHLARNMISATVGLVYINLQPEYELPSSARFGQFQKLKKLSWGTVSSPVPKEKFLLGVWVLVHSYMRVRFDFCSSINFRDINGFPQLWPKPLLVVSLEGPKWYRWILPYDFLLVINCTRGRILHRFLDIAFDMSNDAIYIQLYSSSNDREEKSNHKE